MTKELHQTEKNLVNPINPPLLAAIEKVRPTSNNLPKLVLEVYRERSGWNLETQTSTGQVRPLNPEDLIVRCGDDRDDQPGLNVFGATLGAAHMMGDGSSEGIQKAIDLLASLGIAPTMHTDSHSGGCGYDNLTQQSELSGIPENTAETEEIISRIILAHGIYDTLEGDHQAKLLEINLDPGTTPIHKHKDRFRLSGWFIFLILQQSHPDFTEPQLEELFKQTIHTSLETVEKLNGPRELLVLTPEPTLTVS
jgi:hypothetical protein